MKALSEQEKLTSQRWTLMRDLGVLQVKLIVDGLRDLILVPASLIAGIISLVSSNDGKPGLQFYQLLGWGKQTEVWINLFGAARNSPEKLRQPNAFADHGIDDIVRHFELFVVDEYRRGGVTAQAKHGLDKILDALQRKRRE